MTCLGECLDLGPPPDGILFMPPPPPAPDVLRDAFSVNATLCELVHGCDPTPWGGISSNRVPARTSGHGDYVEMPRKDLETWSVSGIDDTWLLVLVASSIGVLLLGALLAMFLLKCREMNMFSGGDCSTLHSRDHRNIKIHLEQRECSSVSNINGNKLVHAAESVIYQGSASLHDNRLVWAALTPRGTQHFVSENYPRDLIDYNETDDHYETIDNLNLQPVMSCSAYHTYRKDYDYEDPTPLIESYQMSDMDARDSSHYQILANGNPDMKCASLGIGLNSLRRSISINRPRVSSPTRIEHPNLPPLNLYPQRNNTLKMNSTLNYKTVENSTLPKYGI